MKNMKFRVRDAAHSAEIQKALFAAGYGWCGTQQSIQYTDKGFLYADKPRYICHSPRSDEAFFESQENIEHVLVDGKFYEKGTEPTDKIVEHDGVEYKVPSWAKFLVRERAGEGVTAFEFKPKFSSCGGEFNPPIWHNERAGVGRVAIAKVHIEPKPEGNFIKEI